MYSMGRRYTEADFVHGLTRKEAKLRGWTRKRIGTLRMYFDGLILMEAYSYNTCIMARMDPCKDFPYGRMILNETNYGQTSNKHMRQVLEHCRKLVRGHEVERMFDNGDGSTYSRMWHKYFFLESADYTHRAILIDVRMNIDADGLNFKVINMQRSAASERTAMHGRRVARIAKIREYNRSVENYNALHNHANVICFREHK